MFDKANLQLSNNPTLNKFDLIIFEEVAEDMFKTGMGLSAGVTFIKLDD